MRRIIKLDHITKIEGHANLNLKIEDGKVKKARIEIVEGARFFEAIIQGRKYDEVQHLTSRICGVCSPIHVITSTMAVENAFEVDITEQSKMLRELLVLGGVIQSHAMHLYFLALPDYKGYSSAIAMASKFKKEISNALEVKRLGNKIVEVVGGREVHPITCIPGGFSKTPDKERIAGLLPELKKARQMAAHTAEIFQNIKYPDFERETSYFALEGECKFTKGNMSCVGGKCIPTEDYASHFKEYIVPGSAAKFAVVEGKSYMVGALARLNLNHKNLSDNAKKALKFKFPSFSPFMNNVAQAIELVHCVDKCIEIIENLDLRNEEPVKVVPREARGIAVTEAPRGLLFHDYTLSKEGCIVSANIITPTAQNLRNIEDDIKAYLPGILNKNKDYIVTNVERLIRAYDPCISCSAHFLKVNWE